MNNFLMLSQRRNKRGRLIEEGQGERERGREGEKEQDWEEDRDIVEKFKWMVVRRRTNKKPETKTERRGGERSVMIHKVTVKRRNG